MKSSLVLLSAILVAGAADAETCKTLDAVLASAPSFERFHVVREKVARSVAIDLKGNPTARLYRTALREAAKEGVNFAGRYTVAGWGCGTACLDWGVIDLKSGKVIFNTDATPLANLSDSWTINEELTKRYAAQGANKADFDQILFRPDSALLITLGAPGEDEARSGIAYWHWTGKRFERTAFVPYKSICRLD